MTQIETPTTSEEGAIQRHDIYFHQKMDVLNISGSYGGHRRHTIHDR